ncbi:sulfatase-like hydrolase/transferase [Flexithrix dorotheae]|uniref:sulfatase-like hydrolase/transferase n=1 Tax=Flexithrix dorotheae TaxID=70993 RepID=UPI00036C75EA|nr:sulfatase-like hydrolase/transferase [Flexithrix dorotheae]
MLKQTLSFIYLITITFFACSPSEENKENLPPPNILWIVSEDNSPLLGCYGDTFATTPVLDKLATEGVLYENAFATAPVCAPSRSTLITGVYPPSMGTEHMRSYYPIPSAFKFYPFYLKEAGYYCTNNSKKDYNTAKDQESAWDESSNKATYKNRKEGQPFFAIFNLGVSHESSVHKSIPNEELRHDPATVPIPPYHPRTPEMEHDWAQYYDKVEDMDTQVGEILAELEKEGLAENTIVFYYSDHGGVLGRSKRFLYESGLHIPLIIRFPEKYKHLASGAANSRTDQIVTFLDFAPTLLSLAGITIPDHMQGQAFLGDQKKPERKYSHSFRGRMDEVYDMGRSVRNKKYRYTRNYMPHRIYGQYLEYLWKAPSMPSWENAYKNGELNEIQSAFWETKPAEELYDCEADPHNVNNLANDPAFKAVLDEMRQANKEWILNNKDIGFLPEAEIINRSENSTPYELVHQKDFPLEEIVNAAEIATMKDPSQLDKIKEMLSHPENGVRYWGVTGCIILGDDAASAKDLLLQTLNDASENVAIASAEALYNLGEKDKAVQKLVEAVSYDNVMARVHALNILKIIGEDARPALPAAKRLLAAADSKDKRYDLRASKFLVEQLEGEKISGFSD